MFRTGNAHGLPLGIDDVLPENLIRIITQQTNHWESPTKSLEKDIDQDWCSAFRLTTITYHRSRIRRNIQCTFVV